MKYMVGNIECNVFIEKKNNKNTYIRIKEDLNIYVTTNYFITKNQIKEILDKNYEYLDKTLNKVKSNLEKANFFYYLGKKYDIIIMPIDKITIMDDKIYIKDENSLNKWVLNQIKIIYKEHLDILYNKFEEKIPYPKLKIRKMKTRWGVCNRKDNSITINSELIKYELDKLDYVIIHELSHFVHFNHSKNFWLEVSKYCPNYKQIKKELKG